MKSSAEKKSLSVSKETRQKVLNSIDSENVINLCSRLIQFDSVVENEAAEKEISDYVAAHFRKLGLDVRSIDLPEGLPGVPKGPHPQVIATLKGSAGKPIFMVEGHLDTEPVVNRDKWTHDPFSGDVDRKEGKPDVRWMGPGEWRLDRVQVCHNPLEGTRIGPPARFDPRW
jgi:acetylornithine deacetylase/succinyl-diaminopimelate desuccinylase-like protein